jgi:hypothetical protein
LRAGFVTSAARSGASIWKLADQSRHRSMDRTRLWNELVAQITLRSPASRKRRQGLAGVI